MNDEPWLPYLAIDYLVSLLQPDMTVFEYGSGGSTLFFSQRVKRVISIEHDIDWYHKFNMPANVEYFLIGYSDNLIGDEKSNPNHYTSNPFLKNFRDYVCAIEQYNNLDLVLIDGRSRASCLKHAHGKVKSGGWIILDNAEREYYLQNTRHLFEKWETVEFYGYGPQIDWPWRTLFMRKPE